MAVGDDVYQFAGLQTGHLGHHMGQYGVLHDVPAVCGEHILTALVQNGVQGVAGHVERHRVGAGIQGHFAQVVVVINIGKDAAASGVVLQIPQHLVHLVHVALRIVVLYPQLIAVGFADGAVLIGPGVPDPGAQVVDVVALGLPDPQQLVNGALPEGAPDGEDGELLRQVIAVHNAEFLDGMGALAVLPPGADRPVRIPDAVVQNVPAVLDEDLVCSAHIISPCFP